MAVQEEVSYTCDLCGRGARHIGYPLQVGPDKTRADLCDGCVELFADARDLIRKLVRGGAARSRRRIPDPT